MAKKGDIQSLQTRAKISKSLKGRSAPNKGEKRNELVKEKQSIGRKMTFTWVKNHALKDLLTRDYAMGNLCVKHGLNKPAIILYAGIIEAMLVNETKNSDYKFSELIDSAYEKNLISLSKKHSLHVLKDFRNYIHLHRETAGDFELTNGIAQLAQEICESVINNLSRLQK